MQFSDVVDISSRTKTSEGFLRCQCALTRVGILNYDAAYLGVGPAGQTVRVKQTAESVFHPETIASARGMPITLDHPMNDQDVTPDNYRWLSVGNVMGAPQQMAGGLLGAEFFIGDKGAIEALEQGKRHVSVGKTFDLIDGDGVEADYLTQGPIVFNHAALVDRGRAGSEVQVFDQPEDEMKPEEITAAVAKAVADSLAGKDAKPDAAAISQAVTSAMSPLMTQLKSVVDTQTAAEKTRKDAEFAAEAKKAADKLVADTLAVERTRQEVLINALPLIPEAKRSLLKDASVKDILVAAVGDALPNAAQLSEDYLRGALDTQLRSKTHVTHHVGDPPVGGPARPLHGQDAVSKAQDAYLAHIQGAHSKTYGEADAK